MGKMLVAELLEQVRQIGYTTIRLDSTRYMAAAHALYYSFGFREIGPYLESAIPGAYCPHFGSSWNFNCQDETYTQRSLST